MAPPEKSSVSGRFLQERTDTSFRGGVVWDVGMLEHRASGKLQKQPQQPWLPLKALAAGF